MVWSAGGSVIVIYLLIVFCYLKFFIPEAQTSEP
jgi:hypothetical protein